MARSPAASEQLQLSFDWKSVNGEIGAEPFDWKSWNLPQGTRVVDVRMGEDKPLLVEWIGMPAESELPPTLKPVSSNRRLLVLVNVVIFRLLAGWFLKRFIRTRRNSGIQ